VSNETMDAEDQEQTGHSELSEIRAKRLALLESEEFIRRYLFRYVSVGGIILFLLSFGVGFFVDRIAFQSASNQALLSAQGQIISLIREVMVAKSEVDNAVKSAQASSVEISKTEEKAKQFGGELSTLRSKLDSTVAFQASDPQIKKIAEALARDPRITSTLDELDKSIEIRLKKADGEIEKIKTTYKLDCQEAKLKSLLNFKEIFTFSFPVKHAWIQLIDNLDEPYHLVPVIKDDTVIVKAECTHPSYYPDPDKALRRSTYRPFVYRVWATSF
jgi:hypothetical protein